ncbi:hypothetical protein AGMMS4956_05360 [Bacteroidia bacterium]|nr:hypothetical protein AGMMS4956_05360 [Bacteroidia bacterium]
MLSPNLSFSKIDTCLSLLIIPVIFSVFKLNALQIQRCLQVIFYVLLALVVVCWGAFLQHIVCEHLLMEALHTPKAYYPLFLTPPWFWHPSFVSMILVFVMPLAFYLRFNKGIPPLLLWAAILLTLPLIYFTGARIGIVVSLLLLMFAFIFYIKRFLNTERVAIVLLTVALALVSIHLSHNVFNDPIRKDLRALGIKAIAEHPVVGSGVYAMEGYIQSAEFTAKHNLPAYPFNHFHCTPIDEVVQFGAVGGIISAAFLICIFILAWRKKDFLLLALLVIYLPFILVESPFHTVKGIMPMMFWLCLLISTQKERL